MSEVLPRITGTEMEWPIFIKLPHDPDYRRFDGKRAEAVIKKYCPPGIARVSSMLSNGARYYLDPGGYFLEYATPEDTSFWGTVTNEIAGERLVYSSLARAQRNRLFHDFKIYKRVVDDELHTWGYHMNFASPADKFTIDEKHLSLIGLHLATQNIYAGAGTLFPDPQQPGKMRFSIAQKVLNLNCDFASSSHGKSQPLLSTRQEPLADEDRYTRVHLTSVDANISPWATWMRLGTTSLVLRLAEAGERGADLMPATPMFVMAQQVATDLSLRRLIELKNGTTITALQMQEELLARVKKLPIDSLPEEEQSVITAWEGALADLQQDPTRLSDRTDWVAKKAALDRLMARHGKSLEDEWIQQKDKQWDELGANGIGLRLRKNTTGWGAHMPAEEDIVRSFHHAPTTTRAALREQAIRHYVRVRAREEDSKIGWASAWVKGGPWPRRPLDPYETAA